jgi:hypothetical protein
VEDKERIFELGFGKNTGYGLFLVREVLSITGFSIRETGEEGKGARFEISIPPGMYRYRGPETTTADQPVEDHPAPAPTDDSLSSAGHKEKQ